MAFAGLAESEPCKVFGVMRDWPLYMETVRLVYLDC